MYPSKASQLLLNLDEESLARLLASAPGPDAGLAPDQGDFGHVETDLLARYAIQPERLSRDQRERCGAHMEACADCRQELELTRAAVLAARPDRPESRLESEPQSQPAAPRLLSFARRRPAVRVAQRLALAAGLVLTAGTALFVGLSLQGPDQQVLTGADFDGVKRMTARESILVNHTTLHRGARLALDGGDVVAFGEGFSVAEGAGLTVSTTAYDNDEASG